MGPMTDLFGWQPDANPMQADASPRVFALPPTQPDAASVPIVKPMGPDAARGGNGCGSKAKTGADADGESKKKDTATLHAEREYLRLELAEWTEALHVRKYTLAPYARTVAGIVAKMETINAAYGPPPREGASHLEDLREGHRQLDEANRAAHPHRKAVAEAERIVKECKRAIQILNKQIGDG